MKNMKNMKSVKKLFALRGACRCQNTAQDIQAQTAAMYDGLLSSNNLEEKDIVSIIFSVTADIDAANPAAVLRASGRAQEAALFVTAEAPFAGTGLDRVIRVIIHCYLDEDAAPKHMYTNGAQTLRPDWPAIRDSTTNHTNEQGNLSTD
jgi:chorismate mutase